MPAPRPPLALLALAAGGAACSGSSIYAPAPAARPAASAAPAAVGEDGCGGEATVDVVAHAVDLTVGFAPPALGGEGEVRVRARRATDRVRLDARALTVSAVTVGGAPARFRSDGEHLCVRLPAPVAAGGEAALRVAWAAAVGGETPRFAGEQAWAGYQTAAWMPTVQDPSQRATLTLRLTAPAGLRVAASGRRAAVTAAAGATTTTFVVDRPSPPFLFAFAAGRLDEAERESDGVTLRALGPPGADLAGALALTAPMLAFLRDRTGAPYPAADYTQVFVPGEAAQEAAGMALIGASALDDVRRDPTEDWVFSHELAHQWFAWLVPCADFRDLWLNEGLASFMVAAYKEQRWGREAYEREVALWRRRSARVHADRRDAPVSLARPGDPRPPLREADLPPRGVTYARGALVLHRLRQELGDAVFWASLRRHVADRAGRGATSEDLRASAQAASGRDLGDFFARWVYAPAPDL